MNGNISALHDELNHNMTAAVLPVTVFIGIEAFVGLVGNSLILLIYSKRYKKSNFRYIVLSLAVVDLTSCCTTLPGEIFSQLNWYNYRYGWICKVKSYFNICTAWASASILLILAFDRYRKICRPLSWQLQPSVALHLCGISFILSLFVSIPVTIFWGKQTYMYEVNGANLTVSVCEKSDQYADGIYPLVYIGSVYVLPVSFMIFVAGSLNFLTAKILFGHNTLEVRSRRLSISATTLTSISFERDFNCTLGKTKATSEDEGRPDTANSSHHDPDSLQYPRSSHATESCDRLAPVLENKHADINRQNSLNSCDTISNVPRTRTGSLENCSTKVDTENGKVSYNKNDKKNNNNNVEGEMKACCSDNSEECSKPQDHKRESSKKSRCLKSGAHRKQKTVIMLVLTAVFVFTMSTYIILTSFVAKPDGILKVLSNSQKVVFFFFWRLYFVNSVINPILYGFMDPRFRSGLLSYIPGYRLKRRRVTKTTQSTFLSTPEVKIIDADES